MNVKSPNNISEWQMGFNSAFKVLKLYFILIVFFCSCIYQKWSLSFKSSYYKFVCNYFLYVPHTPPVSVYSIYSFGQENNCRSLHYLIFLSLASFSPSQVLISTSAPFSLTPPMHAVPSSWDQDSHTHIEQKTNYYFCYFNLYVVIWQTGKTNLNQTVASFCRLLTIRLHTTFVKFQWTGEHKNRYRGCSRREACLCA